MKRRPNAVVFSRKRPQGSPRLYNAVQHIHFRNKTTNLVHDIGFIYQEPKRFKRITKWLFNKLVKFKVLVWKTETEKRVARVPVGSYEQRDIMAAMNRARLDLCKAFEEDREFVILCGQKEMSAILRCGFEQNHVYSLNVGPIHYMRDGHQQVLGMTLHVVPWMTGWLLVPKVLVEKVNDPKQGAEISVGRDGSGH